MQEFESGTQEGDVCQESRSERLEQMRMIMRMVFKRVLVFVCFGPGVLGCLWLIGRILKR
jgi:hypothetical protein